MIAGTLGRGKGSSIRPKPRPSSSRVQARAATPTPTTLMLIRGCIRDQGTEAGGTRRLVACSKAKASSSRRGSLQAIPVKLTPKGEGFASNPAGKGGVGESGTIPKGTITVGYPGFAA